MNKMLLVSTMVALGMSSAALAHNLPEPVSVSANDEPGFYVGVQGGYGLTGWKNLNDTTVSGSQDLLKARKHNGALVRVSVGGDLTENFGLEFGGAYFFNKPVLEAKSAAEGKDATQYAKIKNTYAFDMTAKIKANVIDNLDLYTRAGVAYLISKADAISTPNAIVSDTSIKNLCLAFAVGAEYAISREFSVGIEYMYYSGNSKIAKKDDGKKAQYQPAHQAVLAGVKLKFGV